MPENTSTPIPWARVLVEGVVIVASILLALAGDAWRQGLQDRADEYESLELLARDLAETVDQMTEFVQIMDESLAAATFAFNSLSGSETEFEQASVAAAIGTAGARRTVRIPSAAYTDLLSTGSLRLIEDRGLRDRIIRFYEEAQRSEAVIAANNASGVDRLVHADIHGRGLVLNSATTATGVPSYDDALSGLRDSVGEEALRVPGRLWTLPPSSAEWAQVRGTMLQVAIVSNFSRAEALRVMEGAAELQSGIEDWLASGS